MNLTYESLKEKHGDGAEAIWNKVCETGGWGVVPTNHAGGLDLAGLDKDARKTVDALIKGKETKE